MQVKKFEAPTMQEALDHVKKELGPEAIILQTKKNKRGFGPVSKFSFEITAAVSDRSLQKKRITETRLPETAKANVRKMNAENQANFFDKYTDRHLERAHKTKDRVELGRGSVQDSGGDSVRKSGRNLNENESGEAKNRRITATRYIDIEDTGGGTYKPPKAKPDEIRVENHVIPKFHSEEEIKKRVELEEEVRQLKKVIEEIRNQQSQGATDFGGVGSGGGSSAAESAFGSAPGSPKARFEANPAVLSAFEHLILNGLDRRSALGLLRKVTFHLGPDHSKDPQKVMDGVLEEMLENLKVDSLLKNVSLKKQEDPTLAPTAIALIGPSGVGKTTTLAKIASEALLKRNLKVGFINLDQHKPTTFDQTATYAKILKIPFRSVSSVDDLRAAMSDFHSLDLVLIDTAISSHRDQEALKEVQQIISSVPDLVTCLVVSATTRDTELYETASRFSLFNPKGLIISKLDEAMVFGSIYNLYQKSRLPLLYFTTGQKIPDDIELATAERVVALVLDI